MDKYGFIYIWRDRKNGKFYLGCHWGTEDDGYICSSMLMRKAYRRRPHDFKRRVIQRIYSTRQDLLELEHKWLSLIPDESLGTTYYNLTKRHFGHWTANEETGLSVREKISKAKKGKPTNSSTKFKKGEHRGAATEFTKGTTAHNKGLALEEQYGAERAQQIKAAQSTAKLGKPSNSPSKFKKGQQAHNKGKRMSEASKLKMIESKRLRRLSQLEGATV